jgi:hypothetical protein
VLAEQREPVVALPNTGAGSSGGRAGFAVGVFAALAGGTLLAGLALRRKRA